MGLSYYIQQDSQHLPQKGCKLSNKITPMYIPKPYDVNFDSLLGYLICENTHVVSFHTHGLAAYCVKNLPQIYALIILSEHFTINYDLAFDSLNKRRYTQGRMVTFGFLQLSLVGTLFHLEFSDKFFSTFTNFASMENKLTLASC